MSELTPDKPRFADCFEELTTHKPLRWQNRLFDQLMMGEIPGRCTLPTGLGKTSIIPIWLIALACGAKLPTRLVYVVDRRTVVDQATDDATRFAALINDHAQVGPGLRHIRAAFTARCAGSASPLAVSTLRGELADNGEWKTHPVRPAIVIGTIDMIGSKLLFSGYGDGRYGRAHHAGLIGQDTLIVHDESHLSPAFDVLLNSIEAEQRRTAESRPIRVMRLSATTRIAANSTTIDNMPFSIQDADCNDQIVARRLNATKTLRLRDSERNAAVTTIVEESLKLAAQPSRVLIYVRSPETAARIAEELRKRTSAGGADRVALLTGTIRGFERDALARGTLFAAFRSNPSRAACAESVFLVSTSAGEVGADLDADHLVCDLSTLDSMAQRFGRVNRLGGEGRSAAIVCIREPAKGQTGEAEGKEKRTTPLDAAIAITGEILSRVVQRGGDVSPKALGTVLASDEATAAFSPTPKILPVTDILFDQWSLTSIVGSMPGRPPVEPYLHGVAEWEPPETHIVWRADIGVLAGSDDNRDSVHDARCSVSDLEEVFDAFPLRSAELLRERTDRAFEQLQELAKRHPERLAVVEKYRTFRWKTLAEIAPLEKNEKARAIAQLEYATVILPTEVGGLTEDGTFNGKTPAPLDPGNPHAHRSLDKAETPARGTIDRQRTLVIGSGDDGASTALLGGREILGVASHSVVLPGETDEEGTPTRAISYRVANGQNREPGERIGLAVHNTAVRTLAATFAMTSQLTSDVALAVELAGNLHDSGKSRDRWQRYAKNLPYQSVPGGPIAKSNRYGHWKDLNGYRHEFGSLLDADALLSKDAAERDLILHLIAAHHGWSRPHFEPRHFDLGDKSTPRPTSANELAAIQALLRFVRLQQRFGRWGLAWLESLVRCADATASAQGVPNE